MLLCSPSHCSYIVYKSQEHFSSHIWQWSAFGFHLQLQIWLANSFFIVCLFHLHALILTFDMDCISESLGFFFSQDFAAYIGKKKINHSSFPIWLWVHEFSYCKLCVSMFRHTKWQTCSALIIIAIYRNIHCRCSAMQAHLTGFSGFSGCLLFVFSWVLWMSFFSIPIFSIQLYVLTLLNIQKHSPWLYLLCFAFFLYFESSSPVCPSPFT